MSPPPSDALLAGASPARMGDWSDAQRQAVLGGTRAAHVGIVGCGAIGRATAAWLASAGYRVSLWSPGGHGAQALRHEPLRVSGLLTADVPVGVVDEARQLAELAETLVVAVPTAGHRQVMDALLPHLVDGQTIIVSAMASLSPLYLYEAARARGRFITVVGLVGTTVSARCIGPHEVRILDRNADVGLATLPAARGLAARELCESLFGAVFRGEANVLAGSLAGMQPVLQVPLALFNWTRIERAEVWPQFLNLTPQVARVVLQLDSERLAIAQACGLRLRGVEQQLAHAYGSRCVDLIEIAADIHERRGGPLGPVHANTRQLAEGVPYGLAFWSALGRLAKLPTPAIDGMLRMAGLLAGMDPFRANDLLQPLGLAAGTVHTLLARVNVPG